MKKVNWKIKVGVGLIIISIPLFLVLPLVPFINIEADLKVKLGTAVFIMAEVLFWSGGLLVGKELFAKYKAYFNPKNWFRGMSKESNRNVTNSNEG